MDREDDLLRQIEALRERLSRLSEASLRINESLDFDTVLQGVVDSACALMGAQRGGMTVLDEAGNYEDFLHQGFTQEEMEQLWSLPDGPELFRRFINIQESMRHRDMRSFAASQGLSMGRVQLRNFIVAPMRHRGAHTGSFFLANKEAAGGVLQGRRRNRRHIRLPGRLGDLQRAAASGRPAGSQRSRDPD